ncbi:hypothetical protein BWK60_01975 [Flavobacterium covae]|uniref:phage major capsid protein n=1 Tax=Flavobacterium covae TaxID=2906076 RepID=UPI000B4CC647|nr:phage major capsid protein [Flavobacterium covae]OWP87781.1 hypothetical protein BWK60_01975 [Flavobacterium covae]
MEALIQQLGEKIENLKAEQVKKEEIDTLKNQLEEIKKGEISDALKGRLDTLADEIAALKENNFVSVNKSFEQQLIEQITEKAEEIKQVFEAKSGVVKMVLKEPALITTANGTNTSPPALTGTQIAPLSPVNLRTMQILSLTNQLATSEASYPYTEAKPKDGDYSFVAEGAVKPQIDFVWETNYATPKTIAAWVKLTKQSVYDVKGLQSIATDYLRKKHDLKKAKSILIGDGLGENPKGATNYGRAFSAGALALAVVKPNFMDVVNACITDIATTHNYEDETPYMANLVMVNPNDFYIHLVSAKDNNGLPLYPNASLFNQVNIGGLTIVPEESIPAGKIFVADMSKYNTTDYESYNVIIGWVNDDLIRNQFVILGESRMHAFVKKLDEQAFIYDDIATIKTAITKP